MEIRKNGNDSLAILKGELDAYQSIDFKKRMIEEAINATNKRILVDMTNLSYIDSAGLGALVSLLKRANEGSKEIRFFGMRNNVKKIFELTKLNMIFKIFDTYEEASA
uniref:Anti-sigma factor antagonist n=1 Tax=Mesoaciditoga lauensis TaxID=1495039 RepID=A0A7V3VS69_9BACT